MNDPGLDEPIREQTREAERSLENGEKTDGNSTRRRRSGGGGRIGSPGEWFGGKLAKEEDKVDKALTQPKFVIQYSFLR